MAATSALTTSASAPEAGVVAGAPLPTPHDRRSLAARIALSGFVVKLVPAVVFLVGWQLAANHQNSLLIPNATETLSSVAELVRTGSTWEAMWISNQSLIFGFAAAIVTGIATGLFMGRFRFAEKMADVWINVLVVLPMAMLMPIIIMAIGFDLRARALVVLLFSYPMVAVNSRAGVREVPTELIDMARVFGAKEREIWLKILIPAAAPAIWTGLRLGLGRAITGMILSELLLVAVGIGELLQYFKGTFQPEMTYALVGLVVAESLLLMAIVRRLERLMVPWAQANAFADS